VGASLVDACLDGADLRDAVLWTTVPIPGRPPPEPAVLTGASLSGANLEGVDLRRLDLHDVQLDGVRSDRHTRWPPRFFRA
jgi:uncharacterized protein YjbI with pentapeptide repeats